MTKDRNLSLDLLRVIACYLVIQQHASEFYYIGDGLSVVTGDNTFWIGIITSLCRTSVPLFVMLSGFLLLPMQGSISTFSANGSPASSTPLSCGVSSMPAILC